MARVVEVEMEEMGRVGKNRKTTKVQHSGGGQQISNQPSPESVRKIAIGNKEQRQERANGRSLRKYKKKSK